ncbi:MAG: hypothetical protein ACYSRZ_01060 [Planctomycetota bacterium]
MGCNSDIVSTARPKALSNKCVYIEPIQSQDPYVGMVLRDVFEKEFVRRRIDICDANTATVFISGSTFMTFRASPDAGSLSPHKSAAANQAIESISLIAKDAEGQLLMSASYDNRQQFTASRLAKEFGSAVADKLK